MTIKWPREVDVSRAIGGRGKLVRVYKGADRNGFTFYTTTTEANGVADEETRMSVQHIGQTCVCVNAHCFVDSDPDFWVQFDDGFCMGATNDEVWFD